MDTVTLVIWLLLLGGGLYGLLYSFEHATRTSTEILLLPPTEHIHTMTCPMRDCVETRPGFAISNALAASQHALIQAEAGLYLRTGKDTVRRIGPPENAYKTHATGPTRRLEDMPAGHEPGYVTPAGVCTCKACYQQHGVRVPAPECRHGVATGTCTFCEHISKHSESAEILRRAGVRTVYVDSLSELQREEMIKLLPGRMRGLPGASVARPDVPILLNSVAEELLRNGHISRDDARRHTASRGPG